MLNRRHLMLGAAGTVAGAAASEFKFDKREWHLPAGRTKNAASGPQSDQEWHGISAGRCVAEIASKRRAALNLRPTDQSGHVSDRRIDAADSGVAIDAIAGDSRANG